MSQTELGELCQPSATHAAVSQWESGRAGIGVARLLDLARVFHVPAAYFLGEIELTEADLRGEEPRKAVSGFDPDEAPTPRGLDELIESGMVLTGSELARMRGYANPRQGGSGANGAQRWTAEQWLDVLMEERRLAWRRKLGFADGARGTARRRETEDGEDTT